MRGWGWVGGVVAVLVGVALTVGLVGAPRSTAPDTMHGGAVPAPADEVGGEGEIDERGERLGLATAITRRIERDLDGDVGDDLADEIERQRSAMRAAIALLVAGEDAGARIR